MTHTITILDNFLLVGDVLFSIYILSESGIARILPKAFPKENSHTHTTSNLGHDVGSVGSVGGVGGVGIGLKPL
ncbi:hypothetical protein [Nodularia chucula]|uniref:hypothetical protein n=1 Tax=Nodularia chucula TaxID=3093667 RepID=UPI0039C6EBE6